MSNTAYLKNLLLDKARKEQDSYIEQMKAKPPDKIIQKAYEITMRDDILVTLEYANLSDKQLAALLKTDYPVSACFNEWQDRDCSYMEDLSDTVNQYAEKLVKEAEEQNINKKRQEPER